ncbi:hypothetical protein ACQ4PT_044145 [Festuca glaucescens]
MVVETRICADISSRSNKFDVIFGVFSYVHLRCTVTFKHATRRLHGGGSAVPDRVNLELPPWPFDEVRPVRDPSIFLHPDDALHAVHDMLATMPPLSNIDLSPANWDGEYMSCVITEWLHEQGSRWLLGLGNGGGERRRCRFKVEARLQVKLVVNEPRAVLQRCFEVTMQTVVPRSDSDQECVICLDEFRNADKSGPVSLPCSHTFHLHCMLTWLDRGTNCPACRYDLTGMVDAPWTSARYNTTAARPRRRGPRGRR